MYLNRQHEQALDLLKENKVEEALEKINLALEENGLNPDILSDRGVIYIHLKKKNEALADFDSAINLQPNYGFRYAARAYAKDVFGRTEDAVLDYQQAIDLDPEDAISMNNLGLLEEKLGRKEQAKRLFEQADFKRKLQDEADGFFENRKSFEQVTAEQLAYNKKIISEENMLESKSNEIIPTVKSSYFAVFKKVLFTKEGQKEFLRFVKNGFKNPKND